MMLDVGLIILLLAVSLWLCWSAKPHQDTEWSGEQAADMASGLILAAAAIGNLWLQISGNDSAILLLDSLAWYAALPLLVSVRMIQAAQGLGMAWYWDRMIWGRVLLALCVVFELCRRANQLDIILYVTAASGAVSLILMAIKPLFKTELFVLASLWIAMSAAYVLYQPINISGLLIPTFLILVFKLSRHIPPTKSH